ncbi:MAG: nuclease [Deltaproteobacteria bacterium]|nr:nuclease [Deltaproteobacteria bacterium]
MPVSQSCTNPKRPGFYYVLRIWWALALAGWAVAILPGCEAPKGPPREGAVAQVLDGDTVVLAGTGHKVRLLGIDAPEMEREGQPAEFLAHQARAELDRLTRGQELRLEYDQLRYDHYGRTLAYLFLPSGAMVNSEMVRQGLSHVYSRPPNVRFRDALLAAQREALEARRGIWQKRLKQDEPHYLVNRNSLIFHRPNCALAAKMAPANRMRLDSLKEGYLQGFSPCRSCKPGG